MLNGVDPIIIFEFSKIAQAKALESVSSIPIVSSIVSKIGLPPIPIYLDENLTGLYIDSEDRNIDIETSFETLTDGGTPTLTQKAINSVVRINMLGSRESIGLTLLSALCDLVVPKVSSKEYSITYLHGAVTIFRGLLHSFAVTQSTDNNLVNITVELTKNNPTEEKKPGPSVQPKVDATPLTNGIPDNTPATAPLKSAGGGPGLSGPKPSPATKAPVQLNIVR